MWKSPLYENLMHKARVDLLCEDQKTIIDLKTSRDISPDKFQRDADTFNYWIQAALYMRGVEALMPGKFEHYVIVAVEKKPPYQVATYLLDKDWIKMIQEQLEKKGGPEAPKEEQGLIERYSLAVSTDEWPGYDSLMQLQPPRYFNSL